MKIDSVVKDGLTILSVVGEMDLSNAADLKTVIEEQLSAGIISKLIIDLGKVSYLDSSGIGILVASFTKVRKAGGSLKLANLSETVRETLKLTNLIEFFEVYDTLEDALKSFVV